MTQLDDRARLAALNLLAKYGKSLTLCQTVKTYDPAIGSIVAEETAEYTISGLIRAYTLAQRLNTAIQAGDLRVLFAAQGLATTPVPDDRITIDGSDWVVVSVTPTYSGEQVALWEAQVRK